MIRKINKPEMLLPYKHIIDLIGVQWVNLLHSFYQSCMRTIRDKTESIEKAHEQRNRKNFQFKRFRFVI